MKKYVLFKIGSNMETFFWSGKITSKGGGSQTVDRDKAIAFDTARHAYDFAGEYDSGRNLQSWRVGLR